MTDTMRKFTVDRATWVRGGQKKAGLFGPTSLLNVAGNRCCLGFAGREICGIEDRILLRKGFPTAEAVVPAFLEHIPELLNSRRDLSEVGAQIIRVNDDEGISEEHREAELIRLFAFIGVAVTFIGPSLEEYEEQFRIRNAPLNEGT